MIIVPTGLQQFQVNDRMHRFAPCWKIVRKDGTILRFTTHDRDLVLADGATYTPTGGVDLTAWQRVADGEEHNVETRGMITAAAVTTEDLFAGLYNESVVTEFLVDWRYPWAGDLYEITYWVQDFTFDGEAWIANVAGLTSWAERTAGDLYGRDCPYDLGDAKCQVVLASFTTSETVSTVTVSQRRFTINALSAAATGVYDYGKIVWTSGANNGLVSAVKIHLKGASFADIELQQQTPFTIGAGDGLDITQGCDKKHATCIAKFSNLVNHGGFKFIPGPDKVLKYK
jgi:uncharacterized phage protein (TIGR02218 family)